MAARFTDSFLDELRSRSDIVSLVSQYVPLQQKGRRYWGCCPFHNEKTPSFSVNPELQMYYCFGCKKSGNVFGFLMEMENLSFAEAVESLCERAHMQMPELSQEEEEAYRRERSQKERLTALLREAALYYYRALFAPQGKRTFSYLRDRGLSDATIRAFGLGSAADVFEGVTKYLREKGFSETDIRAAGLAGSNKDRLFDVFRGRAMFPIITPQSRVTGFGGRILGQGEPKYLNSAETPVFSKRRQLYALNMLRKQENVDAIIVVEGYMDVVSLYEHGVRGAVATLGTALTEDQARLLHRYNHPVYLCYDGDTAGQMATLRGYDVLRAAGCPVRILAVPNGMDPDEYVRANGAEAFLALREKAMCVEDYKLGLEKAKHDLSAQEGRTAYAMAACRILALMENLVEQEVRVRRLAVETGFSAEMLHEQIRRDTRGARAEEVQRNSALFRRHTKEQPHDDSPRLRAERSLLSALAQDADASLFSLVEEDLFSIEMHRTLFTALREGREKGTNAVAALLDAADEQEKSRIAAVFSEEILPEKRRAFIQDCLRSIRKADLETRIQELQKQIDQQSEAEVRLRMMRELQDLMIELKR